MLLRIRLTARAADELGAPTRTFGDLLEHLGYEIERGERVEHVGAGARLREIGAEIAGQAARAKRSLRYTMRLPPIVTTIGR